MSTDPSSLPEGFDQPQPQDREMASLRSGLRATYRMQLNAGFGLHDAAAIADYLAALGVSHLYASPYLQAAPGSSHGYDVVDPHKVNEEVGGEEGHSRLCQALARNGLGQVLDLVPNHMSTHLASSGPAHAGSNRWWWDVLENGPASPYASYFDVYWDYPPAVPPWQRGTAGGLKTEHNTPSQHSPRVLLPVLGDHLARVLERRELQLRREGGAFVALYYDQAWPVALPSLGGLLGETARRCCSDTLAFIADALEQLPLWASARRVGPQQSHALSLEPGLVEALSEAREENQNRRIRHQEVLQAQLERLCREEPSLADAIGAAVTAVNGDPAALGALLDRQNYRLAYWRVARESLGYRRFFDINTLVGLRVEEQRVFADSHKRVRDWLADGVLDGVRIDHPDGLRDPEGYFRRLREISPSAWVVAEKILESEERLPDTWPVEGTTGYDFLNRVGGLFVDPAGEKPLSELYKEFTGESFDYSEAVRDKKLQVVREVLGGDLNRLVDLLQPICQRRWLDYTRWELTEALQEVVAGFPVYRTYVTLDPRQVSGDDTRYISEAVERARANRPDLDSSVFEFLEGILLLRLDGELEGEFTLRFQQFTGPAMAKGVEDTLFYTFNRLVSLNEVGGNPGSFGVSLEEFHRACAETQEHWPLGLLATSTHDTKRGEDVRSRISLLSEIPHRWRRAVRRWAGINKRHRTNGMPDRNAEYLFYQTLVGAWPLSVERATAYMEKASREAKAHTSWTSPEPGYDAALETFVQEGLADRRFTQEVESFVRPLVVPARVTSLAQTLVKLAAPGVPDIYRGTELWDLSLVDPDNRRPVDFDVRRRLLAELDGATPEGVLARMDEGLPKLWVIQRALALRERHPSLFGPQSNYQPIMAQGKKAQHVVAFSRGDGVVTSVPRLVLGLGSDWADTRLELPPGLWHNEFTDDTLSGQVRLSALLARFPVALLVREVEP